MIGHDTSGRLSRIFEPSSHKWFLLGQTQNRIKPPYLSCTMETDINHIEFQDESIMYEY